VLEKLNLGLQMPVLQPHGLSSPSDLANFIACEHLTQLELAVALGEITRPNFGNAYIDLIKRKGEEHERNFLEALRAAGHVLTEVGLGRDRDFAAAVKATAGGDACWFKVHLSGRVRCGSVHGIADFLERIDRPSALGAWSYQVLDTKLARHPRPEHALQICFLQPRARANSENRARGRVRRTPNERPFPDQGRECIGLLPSSSATFRVGDR
jgi:hypothetical protein